MGKPPYSILYLILFIWLDYKSPSIHRTKRQHAHKQRKEPQVERNASQARVVTYDPRTHCHLFHRLFSSLSPLVFASSLTGFVSYSCISYSTRISHRNRKLVSSVLSLTSLIIIAWSSQHEINRSDFSGFRLRSGFHHLRQRRKSSIVD